MNLKIVSLEFQLCFRERGFDDYHMPGIYFSPNTNSYALGWITFLLQVDFISCSSNLRKCNCSEID